MNRIINYVDRSLVFGVILSVLAFAAHPVMARDVAAPAGDPQRGAEDWAQNCVRCHRLRAPTDFRDDEWEPIVSHMRVRGQLSGQEARNILAFLQIANSPTLPAAEVASEAPPASNGTDGEAVYRRNCQACHGANGRGALPGVPNFTHPRGPLVKSDVELMRSIRAGLQSPGAAMAMPAKGGNPSLNEKELQAVLKFIREKFGGRQ